MFGKVCGLLLLLNIPSLRSLTLSQSTPNPENRLSFYFPQSANCGRKIHQGAGKLLSHPGFAKGEPYSPGIRCRWEIETTKKGNLTIQFHSVGIRDFDFVVITDGSLEHRLTFMCHADRYKRLGTAGVDYLGINQALLKRDPAPFFKSSTNKMFVDFCSHMFPAGNGRVGFEASFNTTFRPLSSSPAPELGKISTVTMATLHSLQLTTSTPLSCGIRTGIIRKSKHPFLDTRVVGGKTAPANNWPWMCSLILGKRHQCGCTVIDNEWVITAGHCFPRIIEEPFSEPKMVIAIGAQDLKNAGIRNLFEVESVIRHEEYINYRGISHDIALVKLKVPVMFKANVQPACLPTQSLAFTAVDGRIRCAVAGWGVMSPDQIMELGEVATGPDELQELAIDTLYSNDECRMAVNRNVSDGSSRIRITDTMFCAGHRISEGGHDTCQGDSGGPLVCQQEGRWTLHGIISYGVGCARPGMPGVFTNVHTLLPWIQNVLEERVR